MKYRFPPRPVAEPAPHSERIDVLAAGQDPLKRRRFNFPLAPAAKPEQEGPAGPLTPAEVQRLVAAGVIRFPQPTGEVA